MRSRLRVGGLLVLAITVAAIVVPAYLREPFDGRNVHNFVAVLPSLYLGFLTLAILAAIASGGGREVVPREQAVAFPVSTVTEHFGALLLAPLNIAWLIQAWTVLGMTTYVLGPHALPATVVPLLLWIALSTAIGQAVGWVFEGIRRGAYGILLARVIVSAAIAAVVALVLTHQLVPTARPESYGPDLPGRGVRHLGAVGPVGGVLGRARRPRRGRGAARSRPGPMGTAPGAARGAPPRVRPHRASGEPAHRPAGAGRGRPGVDLAVGAAAPWSAGSGVHARADRGGRRTCSGTMITILPGLVASGGALLFGVNSWCLDGRGALWRDSLPASASLAYYAKVIVLFEVLLSAAALTLLLAAMRAGVPTSAELWSALAAAVVVSAQVVSASMRWSVDRPFSTDMRSARATPAPPVVMAGYSARLALRTTVVGLVFSATAVAPDGRVAALVAVPMLCWSCFRLMRTAGQWAVPEVRARVVSVVAA